SLVGAVAASDGLFEAAGSRLARLPGGGVALLGYLLALIAAVTVVLNLDTSVVFLTPIVLSAARSRGLDESAFLYGCVFMSNSASLLLPGSNLTNLLVLSGQHVSGATFGLRLFPAWLAAVVVTALVLVIWRWRELRCGGRDALEATSFRAGLGLVGTVGAAVLVLAVTDPALPVLALGLLITGGQVALHRLPIRAAARALNVPLLLALFAAAVGLGTVARLWGAPGRLMSSLGYWQTAAAGAVASVVLNNLPAAVLLASTPPTHPRALLLGLNLGPNLAITGSLSAILWMRVARDAHADPSALTYSRLGVFLVPTSIAAGLVALAVFAPHGLAA
ncbi:MAG: SLC13 family permease, partial [Candidatus Dormibacteria bacterium]